MKTSLTLSMPWNNQTISPRVAGDDNLSDYISITTLHKKMSYL